METDADKNLNLIRRHMECRHELIMLLLRHTKQSRLVLNKCKTGSRPASMIDALLAELSLSLDSLMEKYSDL